MKISPPLRFFLLCALALTLSRTLTAQVLTAPTQGLRDVRPRVHALINARIVVSPQGTIEKGTLIVRDGLIEAAGADLPVPADARVWDLAGKTIYPGFLDSYSHFGLPANLQPKPLRPSMGGGRRRGAQGAATPSPANEPVPDGPGSWNPFVTPQRSAIQFFHADEKGAEKLRSLGFTGAVISPGRGVFRGASALVELNGKDANKSLLAPTLLAQHVAFELSSFTEAQYPTSLMGCIALIRQTFYDAEWYRQAQEFAARHPAGNERPEANVALGALGSPITRLLPVVFETEDELDVGRVARIAEEFKLRTILRGSGYEYRVLDALKKAAGANAGAPALILPLDFPETPEIETPEKAIDITLEELEHWQEAPSNPGRVAKAGIPFALTTATLAKPEKDFWPRLRLAVKRGLGENDALAALTANPAKMFGVADRCGTLEKGKVASFLVASGNLFTDEKAEVLTTWIDGKYYDTDAGKRKEPRGTYAITFTGLPGAGQAPNTFKIDGDPGNLKATLGTESVAVAMQGETLVLLPAAKTFAGGEGALRLTATIADDGVLEGNGRWPDGGEFRWSARRTAAFVPPPKTEKEKERIAAADKLVPIPNGYPAGAFGRRFDEPAAPVALLVRNATVWTSGPRGKLENTDLLVRDGKIVEIGQGLTTPAGATVIEAAGRHVTPGLIDCHSHSAIARGVNEGTHAVTCEVRIGDVLDATDIAMYRELAGGLTAANLLHGSANPIGGQSQTVKLRWGALPEDLKFAGATPGVKFALGENVKQSNWGERFTTRYPQTRMGVEQIIRDRFLAAQEYDRAWSDFRKKPAGSAMPPRRDLQLDALVEMLRGERVIHIHSYRQDELLMFIRLAQDFHLKVAAFQHGLECYKVAGEIAQLGAGVSSFSDWWNYKFEVVDAIPYNGAILTRAGVLTSFNSDSAELARRLNTEAAKSVKYGGLSEEEALKLVTFNPAKQLGIEKRVGSLEPGKDADFVIWNGHPLSAYTRAEQTWIDGRCYFDHDRDEQMQTEVANLREALIQKALPERQRALSKPAGGEGGDKDRPKEGPEGSPTPVTLGGETGIVTALEQIFLHRAIHHALEQRGLYHNGADKHNCSTLGGGF